MTLNPNPVLRSLTVAVVGLLAALSGAQINAHSDGSDGALVLNGSDKTLDLSLAATGNWDTPSPVAGQGVYDAAKWAVVYKFSSVLINNSLYFTRNRSNAPVIFLVQGDVTINGRIFINGGNGRNDGGYADGGPGGFPGSRQTISNDVSNSGRGPGGGDHPSATDPYASGASYGTAGTGLLPGSVYGNPQILPLIGGSGGGHQFAGGGGGGGAILIVASGAVHINGLIYASGGSGAGAGYGREVGGSGGAIRIVSTRIDGGGTLQALGQQRSGDGRIRLESQAAGLYSGGAAPNASIASPANEPIIFPDATAPTVSITSIGGTSTGADPTGSYTAPDVQLTATDNVEFLIQTLNVPVGWHVRLRIVPEEGDTIYADATLVQQNGQAAQWRAVVTLPRLRFTAIVKAYSP